MKRNRFVIALAAALVGMAFWDQLKRPSDQRTWTGRVGGVPYDLRPVTLDRLLATVWNKDNPSLLVPTAYGVGWTINLYPLLGRKQST